MKTAFISVNDKTQLERVAKAMTQYDIQLIASNGTADFLASKAIAVQSISEYLQAPPILDGRVKTLHPALFAGILADRHHAHHLQELAQLSASLIDFVIVDLYPFSTYQDIEHIDIGGISLIRAAAKNYQYCTVVCEVSDYPLFLNELALHNGQTELAFRKKMAATAFVKSSRYDAAIASWMLEESSESLRLKKTLALSYGENPHQPADFYNLEGELPSIQLLQGKPLSYNNLLDLDSGINLIFEFDGTACAVIKHTNPCGVAQASSPKEAVEKAFHADSKSAFGGIVILNTALDLSTALFLKPHFFEVIAAPTYTQEALNLLAEKSKCRVVTFMQEKQASTALRSALNGFLMQQVDRKDIAFSQETIPTRSKPDPSLYRDMQFAFQVVRHMKSNAIVIVKGGVTLSLGVGQTNRVDAVSHALDKISGIDLTDAVLASDGFFPFADSIDLIAKTSIKTIVQPGGSLRDSEVIAACDKWGISMVMTGVRSFKH
ncbi:MAG: bifunctional phosphoribosylaminoimidazolecarboxamide formyltransferase/IMP cyclohydrolase [Legionellaceae bacterium]|nr:bifunctional phosphoribosylaminoimidazolecarboxamide formyltransferase/IMP cyclohydrolase [Legionellaceae bacterium]